jgi:prolipoprotein diacylglyceryltransferase
MGQWLSIPLSLVGVFMVIFALVRPPLAGGAKRAQVNAAASAAPGAVEAQTVEE